MNHIILNDNKGFSIHPSGTSWEEYYVKSWDAIIHEMISNNLITIWGKVNPEAYYRNIEWIMPYLGEAEITKQARDLMKIN